MEGLRDPVRPPRPEKGTLYAPGECGCPEGTSIQQDEACSGSERPESQLSSE